MNVRDRFMKVLNGAIEVDLTAQQQGYVGQLVLTPSVVAELTDLMDLMGAAVYGSNSLCANALAGAVPRGDLENLFHMTGTIISASPQAVADREKVLSMLRETREEVQTNVHTKH